MTTRSYVYYGQPPLRGPRLRCRVACTAAMPHATCDVRLAVACVGFVTVEVGGIDRECAIFGETRRAVRVACEAPSPIASAALRISRTRRLTVTTGAHYTCFARLKRAAPACEVRVSLATRKTKIKLPRRKSRLRSVCAFADFHCAVRGRSTTRRRVRAAATATPPRYACEARAAIATVAKVTCVVYAPRPFRIKGW